MKAEIKSGQVITKQEPTSETSTVGFKQIIVAVDYQATTEKVFETAMKLAQTFGSRLMVFHCLKEEIAGMPEMVAFTGMGPYGGSYSRETIELKQKLVTEAIEEAQQWLSSFCQRATEKGIPTEFDHKIGEPGPQICSLAKMWGADLIVIGRRGRTGISEMFLGSVSNYVIHQAHCSVLIVQDKAD
ncbi:MAG: universal stress protein [Prochloraceae cyanobacterium]